MGTDRVLLIILGLSALVGVVLVIGDVWREKCRIDREVDARIDGEVPGEDVARPAQKP